MGRAIYGQPYDSQNFSRIPISSLLPWRLGSWSPTQLFSTVATGFSEVVCPHRGWAVDGQPYYSPPTGGFSLALGFDMDRAIYGHPYYHALMLADSHYVFAPLRAEKWVVSLVISTLTWGFSWVLRFLMAWAIYMASLTIVRWWSKLLIICLLTYGVRSWWSALLLSTLTWGSSRVLRSHMGWAVTHRSN